jgi:hypothetical protein
MEATCLTLLGKAGCLVARYKLTLIGKLAHLSKLFLAHTGEPNHLTYAGKIP